MATYNSNSYGYSTGNDNSGRPGNNNYNSYNNYNGYSNNNANRPAPYINNNQIVREDTMGQTYFSQMTEDQLQRQRTEEERRQDRHLDNIHGAVGALKNHAANINDEVTTQNQIIVDLGNNVDNANSVVATRTNQVKQVNKSIATGRKLWIVIIVLIVALVLILILLPNN